MMPKTPQPSVMKGGQRADRQVPAHRAANVGPGGTDRRTDAGQTVVLNEACNVRARATHAAGVMKVPADLVGRNAPGPKALATGVDAGGAPRGGGSFKTGGGLF